MVERVFYCHLKNERKKREQKAKTDFTRFLTIEWFFEVGRTLFLVSLVCEKRVKPKNERKREKSGLVERALT